VAAKRGSTIGQTSILQQLSSDGHLMKAEWWRLKTFAECAKLFRPGHNGYLVIGRRDRQNIDPINQNKQIISIERIAGQWNREIYSQKQLEMMSRSLHSNHHSRLIIDDCHSDAESEWILETAAESPKKDRRHHEANPNECVVMSLITIDVEYHSARNIISIDQ
jgi:hypothetical protein